MHLLLLHQAFVSTREAGGTRHIELARHLIKNGHQVTVVTSQISYLTGQRNSPAREQKFIVKEVIDGIEIWRISVYGDLHRTFTTRVFNFISFMFVATMVSLRVRDIDLVMGTSPPIFQAVSAWLVAILRKCPFLLEIRDLWPAFAIDMGVLKNRFLIALSCWLENFLYARATHILVNSPAYRDYLLNKGISMVKISLIANGVDPDMFNPQADGRQIRNELALGDKFVVTYTGAMGLANDISTTLRAAVYLRNESTIHFLLVGDGKERRNLEAQTQSLALPNVTFAGPRPKTDIPDILAASDACLAILKDIPMFRMTYPNKVFDYMAAGRPTILAIDGVIRQVVEAARGGIFVPPGDAATLAAAVQHLSRDRQQAQAMGASARAYVVKHFNRHQQAGQFVELVRCLANKKEE